MKWDKLNVFTSHPSPLKGSSHFTQYTFHVIDTWQRSLLLTFYGFFIFCVILFFIFCMFRVHKGQGCVMSLLGHSLISNIYKTHMSHQCHLEREGNFNANTGAFLKDVDVNHQAVTGSVRDDWRGPRGLAVWRRFENQTLQEKFKSAEPATETAVTMLQSLWSTARACLLCLSFLFSVRCGRVASFHLNSKLCRCTWNCDISLCSAELWERSVNTLLIYSSHPPFQ